MSKALDDLREPFRTQVFEFIARCAEAGVPLFIVETLRSEAQHQLNLARGVSWTKHSRHLVGEAIDICPYELYTLNPGGDKLQWDANHPVWRKIGEIGERLGLRWGGRFGVVDACHFEYAAPAPLKKGA